MLQCGYGYSRSELVDIATKYAVSLCKRDTQHPLSLKWFHGFMAGVEAVGSSWIGAVHSVQRPLLLEV